MAKLAGVTWNGLDSFKRELEVLTSDLVEEANAILVKAAFDAADNIRASYPYDSGALRGGVVVIPSRGTVLAGAEVKNLAPHAWIYEHGTAVRENSYGWNRGRMPANPTFEPIAAAYRIGALRDIEFRLYWHGATRVTGNADAA